MTNKAILVGNTKYRTLRPLDCCHDDLIAVEALLKATGKYEAINIIENADADSLKTQLRTTLDSIQPVGELFFYFSGHGHQSESEFYFCATNFDGKRPNETGLSTTELHTLLRLAKADLVVKVMDACNSGTLLVKSDFGSSSDSKSGFNNLVQISSCLETQNSLTGDPLSVFTEKFRAAALRKTEGVVYYTDIINTLRDEFNENNSQTPFFVSQGTGREKFVDDATKLDELRFSLRISDEEPHAAIDTTVEIITPPSFLERLRAADKKVVTPRVLETFVDSFYDALISEISVSDFADFFDIEVVEHANFQEVTTHTFIARSLSNERRSDNFVTATLTRLQKNRNGLFGNLAINAFMGNDVYEDVWNLSLNCEISRAQIRVTLTPKFINLQRIVLVVSCAPSLDRCYVFEVVTQHRIHDFNKFDIEGSEVSRRWWKLNWFNATDSVVLQIARALSEAVKGHLVAAEKRLDDIGSN